MSDLKTSSDQTKLVSYSSQGYRFSNWTLGLSFLSFFFSNCLSCVSSMALMYVEAFQNEMDPNQLLLLTKLDSYF